MIENLEWDSDFFGISIGKLIIGENFKNQIIDLSSNSYDLIYIFSESILTGLDKEIKLIDVKVNFVKTLLSVNSNEDCKEFNSELHSYKELLSLAYLSGIYSRFKLDNKFKNDDFNRLYKIWLDRSIEKIIADHILIEVIDEEIAGFVTLKFHKKNFGQIGLIAVNPKFQGRKIASKLIQACENLCLKNNIGKLIVETQLDNKPAMSLYKHSKFSIQNQQFIYHFWNIKSC